MQYITNAAFASWITTRYDCPFLRHVDFAAVTAASFPSGWTYRLKNVNSGLYMQVEGAKAENGANVQQWGTADGVTHDIWKLVDAGDGYYSLISAVGDGGTFALDITGKKTDNGTNVDIYQYNGGDNQKFMLTKNADGSYKLRTKITNGKSAVEIANAGTGSGDNIQQWEINGANCQDWILEAVANPGCKMDTNVSYEFENVNSGMVMDIEAGKMEDGTNVQQWTTGHFNSQKWVLEAFSGGGNYYYIRSFADQGYVLRAASGSNGGNLEIAPYSTKDSAMLFKFSKQPDGSYTILTRASKDGCLLEIPNAGIGSGNNVAQWEPTGHACQRWNAVTEALPEPNEPPTEAPTEAPTETPTQAPTEVPTEAPTAAPTETTSELPTSLRGDADANGTVELLDIIKLQRFLLMVDTLDAQQAENADVNEDSAVDIFDLALLKRLVVQG